MLLFPSIVLHRVWINAKNLCTWNTDRNVKMFNKKFYSPLTDPGLKPVQLGRFFQFLIFRLEEDVQAETLLLLGNLAYFS